LGCDRPEGTGSHDLVVEDVFVPDEWTFVRGAPATIDLPAYRYPPLALAAQVLAVVGLGVARAALDLMGKMAGTRGSITGAPVMAERANVQIALAKGESQWQATRAWFFEVTGQVCAMIEAGQTPRASRWR
jgi:alkylation response protein AidB-like acyl-CoA dehydrogenase